MPSDDENNKQCSLESGWTEAVNVSNTALLSSMSTRWEETDGVLNELPSAFYGDSGKPNIFNSGTFAVISWTDKYCDGGEQRMISYNERGGITLPFSCIYTARANYADVTDVEPTWTPQRITTGIRDAMQDVNKGLSQVVNDVTKGRWIVTWQEDPHGLQIGGADGPGDGASGANVTHGTDIWYTWTYDLGTWGFNKPLSTRSKSMVNVIAFREYLRYRVDSVVRSGWLKTRSQNTISRKALLTRNV